MTLLRTFLGAMSRIDGDDEKVCGVRFPGDGVRRAQAVQGRFLLKIFPRDGSEIGEPVWKLVPASGLVGPSFAI